MKTLLAIFLATLIHTCQAQDIDRLMRGMLGLSEPCSSIEPAWCKNSDGSLMAFFEPHASGIHDALEQWGKARAHLRTTTGVSPRQLNLDAHLPEYVNGLKDYSNLSVALQAGSAWVTTMDEFPTSQGTILLALKLKQKGCIVIVTRSGEP